jgi:hypothetical protein
MVSIRKLNDRNAIETQKHVRVCVFFSVVSICF